MPCFTFLGYWLYKEMNIFSKQKNTYLSGYLIDMITTNNQLSHDVLILSWKMSLLGLTSWNLVTWCLLNQRNVQTIVPLLSAGLSLDLDSSSNIFFLFLVLFSLLALLLITLLLIYSLHPRSLYLWASSFLLKWISDVINLVTKSARSSPIYLPTSCFIHESQRVSLSLSKSFSGTSRPVRDRAKKHSLISYHLPRCVQEPWQPIEMSMDAVNCVCTTVVSILCQ